MKNFKCPTCGHNSKTQEVQWIEGDDEAEFEWISVSCKKCGAYIHYNGA